MKDEKSTKEKELPKEKIPFLNYATPEESQERGTQKAATASYIKSRLKNVKFL